MGRIQAGLKPAEYIVVYVLRQGQCSDTEQATHPSLGCPIDSCNLLNSRIEAHNLPLATSRWCLDLRKYASVPARLPHGIDHVVAWICGLDLVRETIPFARTLNRIYP